MNTGYSKKLIARIAANDPDVKESVAEYLKDPNCWPALWIQSEKLSPLQKAAFLYAVLKS